jgi:hypothetical protein
MSVIGSNLIAGASGQGGGYNLTNSLRTRSSASAYLNRTPASAGNRKTWTWSAWVKRGQFNTSAYSNLFGCNNGASGFVHSRFEDSINGFLHFGEWSGAGYNWRVQTNAVFRDFSSWYHIILVFDSTQATSSNRILVYVNGVNQTLNTTTYPSLNLDGFINSTNPHNIARTTNATEYFDGYMTEVNFVDGQALTPSSFGETSTTTGVWIPKKYSGTYGTNGFYLPFTDNSALTTSSNVGLGRDYSGNGNYWTTNNISITAGTTYDSMTDVPTLTSATTANYAVMNPNWKSSTASTSNANLTVSQTGALDVSQTTMGVSSGKWYWETTITSIGSTPAPMIGVVNGGGLDSYTSANGYYYWSNNGQKFNNGTAASYGAAYTTNDVIGVALDMDAGTLTFYKNNTSQGTAYSGLSGTFSPTFTNGGGPTISWSAAVNFGQRPFAYTPPTGFVALNTFNLPEPSIVKGGSFMTSYTWSGNSTEPRSFTDVGFKPDFYWSKVRNAGSSQHILIDSVRGVNGQISSDNTDAEDTTNFAVKFDSFDANGFTLSKGSNATFGYYQGNLTGRTYVGWMWQANKGTNVTNTAGSITSTVSANPTAGFSIVTYTGNGSTATIGHGLGVAPKMIIVKKRDGAERWCVYHTATSNAYIYLNETFAAETSNAQLRFGNNSVVVQPTSSVFTIGNTNDVNGNVNTYVAYCWSEVAGFSAFGSYTGNGSADGGFVFTSFRPRFVMVKRSDSTGNWIMLDSARNTSNVTNNVIYANLSQAEDSPSSQRIADLLSNGFKIRGTDTDVNASGGTYIYMAFAETPQKFALGR